MDVEVPAVGRRDCACVEPSPRSQVWCCVTLARNMTLSVTWTMELRLH